MRTSTRPWCRPVFTQLRRRGLEKRFQATKYVTKRGRLQIGRHVGFVRNTGESLVSKQSVDMRQRRKRKKQKEQTSTETMNNCVQKEEVKNEKEKEHGFKKGREQSITDQISNKK